jgi:hypothetical protein
MLAKFDSKSNRVKGLSFHPRRPWVLASLRESRRCPPVGSAAFISRPPLPALPPPPAAAR